MPFCSLPRKTSNQHNADTTTDLEREDYWLLDLNEALLSVEHLQYVQDLEHRLRVRTQVRFPPEQMPGDGLQSVEARPTVQTSLHGRCSIGL